MSNNSDESSEKSTQPNGPKLIERSPLGLVQGVEYVFDESGKVDWRKMLKKEHLVPNKQRTSEEDISKLEDRDLLILLSGIKYLASLRGFDSVKYRTVAPTNDYVVATCEMQFLPNYETGMLPITFSSIGDASPNNTNGFGQFFLASIAENRAFVRCVRNFLRISVVAADEISSKDAPQGESSDTQSADEKDLLLQAMKEKDISWDKIKLKLIAENFPNAANLNGIQDLPKFKILEFISRIKKAKKP